MKGVVRWWWVRHAPVEAVGFCGWSDPPADLTDQYMLDNLKMALPEDAVLVSSDLRRASHTADALQRGAWRRSAPEAGLREQNFGEWEGRPYDSMDEAESTAFWSAPAEASPPGGESFTQLYLRVADAIATHNDQGAQDIVAVAHSGVIRAALAIALGAPPVMGLTFEIAPLSLTRIDWLSHEEAWRISAVNVTV